MLLDASLHLYSIYTSQIFIYICTSQITLSVSQEFHLYLNPGSASRQHRAVLHHLKVHLAAHQLADTVMPYLIIVGCSWEKP